MSGELPQEYLEQVVRTQQSANVDVEWTPGLSHSEIGAAEAAYGFQFPPRSSFSLSVRLSCGAQVSCLA